MPYYFEFDSNHRILRGSFVDHVTDDELVDYYHVAALLSDSLRPRAGVTDLSRATASVRGETVRNLAKLPPAMLDANRPRFIVAESDHIFGLARMFQMHGEASRPNLHVTRSSEEAWELLGISETEFQPISKSLESTLRSLREYDSSTADHRVKTRR
jgi:hypothetical protein